MILQLGDVTLRQIDVMFKGFVDASAGADVLVCSSMTMTIGLDISDVTGVPVWFARLCPEYPSFATVPPGYTRSSIGWVNYLKSLAYWISVALALERVGAENASRACRKLHLGLENVKPSERVAAMTYTPQLLAFSRHLFPPPTDYPPWHFEVGFWQVQVRV